MSLLIAMRQRMRAIETIKKVTHAMRLISMSSHARLKSRKKFLEEYQAALVSLISSIISSEPSWKHPILWPEETAQNTLVIIVGSQKGLCGTFNVMLAEFIHKQLEQINPANLFGIFVGKKMVDYSFPHTFQRVMEFPQFSLNTLLSIGEKITNHIWHTQYPYRKIIVYYNYPKSFFLQKPIDLTLIPLNLKQLKGKNRQSQEAYYWEQDPHTILNSLAHKYLQSIIEDLLFQSLIAEQAARFIAMDNSTRNASNLLDTMKLDYNKLRQAKITRELTDLASSF